MKQFWIAIAALLMFAALAACDGCASPAWADSATSPATIKYGALTLGSDDPNADGSTADATTSVITVVTGLGTTVALSAAELAVLDGAVNLAGAEVTGLLPIANVAPGFQQLLYAATAVSNSHLGTTSAETAIMPTAADGSATIAIAQLRAGADFVYEAAVIATGDADGDETLTVNVYFGAQLVGTTGAIAIDGATEFLLRGSVRVRTSSATGTGYYKCLALNGAATPAHDQASFTTFDCTATQALSVKLDWGGTTDAADTASTQDATLRVANFD